MKTVNWLKQILTFLGILEKGIKAHFDERIDILENERKEKSLLMLPNLPKHLHVTMIMMWLIVSIF